MGVTAGTPDLPAFGPGTVKESFPGISCTENNQRVLCYELSNFSMGSMLGVLGEEEMPTEPSP